MTLSCKWITDFKLCNSLDFLFPMYPNLKLYENPSRRILSLGLFGYFCSNGSNAERLIGEGYLQHTIDLSHSPTPGYVWVRLYFPPFPHFRAPWPIVPHCAHLWLNLLFGLIHPASLKSKHNFPAKAVVFQLGSPVLTPCTFFFWVEDCWPRNWNLLFSCCGRVPLSELVSSVIVELLMKQQTNSTTPHQQFKLLKPRSL